MAKIGDRLFLSTRELASVYIGTCSNIQNGLTTENQEQRLFYSTR